MIGVALRRLLGRSGGRQRTKAKGSFKPRRIPRPWVKLIESLEIDLVLDVGANVGQYAAGLRRIGYAGRIVSFEPLSAARAKLERRAALDAGWTVLPFALGDTDGTAILHVAGNSGSSSVLDMLDRHSKAVPISAYVGQETVQMRRLDGILDGVLGSASRPFLKMDVQGFELSALRGAGSRLSGFLGIQLEMSMVPLYAGAALRDEIETFLNQAGYLLAGVLQGFSDPGTGQMLQLDGFFVRRDLLP